MYTSMAIRKETADVPTSDICQTDLTSCIVLKVQHNLRLLKKQEKREEREYGKLYQSGAIVPLMCDTIEAHQPKKDYPLCMIVSTVCMASYGLTEHPIHWIQPKLYKSSIYYQEYRIICQ